MSDIQSLVGKINTLKSQGLSNNQIIQTLERQGYNNTDIFDALNQTQLGGVNTMNPSNQNNAQNMNNNPFGSNSLNQNFPELDSTGDFGMPSVAPEAPGQINNMPLADPGMIGSTNEELIETIIEEKWNDLIKHVNKIIAWKNRTEQQVVKLEQEFSDLKDQFNELHKAVIGKVGEYDRNILNVGAEIKAMEKVFSNVLPVFVNNVKELNDISKKFKIVSKSSSINK